MFKSASSVFYAHNHHSLSIRGSQKILSLSQIRTSGELLISGNDNVPMPTISSTKDDCFAESAIDDDEDWEEESSEESNDGMYLRTPVCLMSVCQCGIPTILSANRLGSKL